MDARKEEVIPWDCIEDRLRRPRGRQMWTDLKSFFYTVKNAYNRNVWDTQPIYLECWLEKDALSGIFEDALRDYGVTLNVGRGYDGWDSIRNAAQRFKSIYKDVSILYFGDFDPSGEDMARSLKERLSFFGVYPDITKCALTYEDIHLYNLPPDFTKTTDSRTKGFKEKFGDIAVELDALPLNILKSRLITEVENRIDMEALKNLRLVQKTEIEQINEMIDKFNMA